MVLTSYTYYQTCITSVVKWVNIADTALTLINQSINQSIYLFGDLALTRREYERLDELLQGLVRRGGEDHGDIHDDVMCRDATFGVLDYKCADFLRDVFHGDLGDMCSSKYYQVHCCQTCSGAQIIQQQS